MSDFKHTLSEWANHCRHVLCFANSTVNRYAATVERYAAWWTTPNSSPHQPSSSGPMVASQRDVETYTGIYAHWRDIKPQSRLNDLAAIKSFYAYAFKRGAIDADPAVDVAYPRAGRPLPKALSLADADKLLMAPGIKQFIGLRDTTMILVLMSSGIRLSGLMGMTERSLMWWNDAGIERLTLRITEKGRKERLVPMPQEAAVLLRAYMGHKEFRSVDRLLPDSDKVLWITMQRRVPEHLYIGAQRRMAQRTFQQLFDRYCEDVGVAKGFRKPHAVRHMYGTELGESDVDLITRQALLGHADPKTTAIYTHMADRRLRALAEKANPLAKMKHNALLANLRVLSTASAPGRKATEL